MTLLSVLTGRRGRNSSTITPPVVESDEPTIIYYTTHQSSEGHTHYHARLSDTGTSRMAPRVLLNDWLQAVSAKCPGTVHNTSARPHTQSPQEWGKECMTTLQAGNSHSQISTEYISQSDWETRWSPLDQDDQQQIQTGLYYAREPSRNLESNQVVKKVDSTTKRGTHT